MKRYNISTFSRHFLQESQDLCPDSRGDLHGLLSGIVLACKIIGHEVRRLGLSDIRNLFNGTNHHGEVQSGLDVFANNVLIECLGSLGNVALIASEENEQPLVLSESAADGRYVVVFDPLDGSSNIDVNVSVGTIFSVYRMASQQYAATDAGLLQTGQAQIIAGYVLYGSSTMLVYTTGKGVHGFTLDSAIGTFVLSHPDIRMPKRGNMYSVNESYADAFPSYCRRFLHWLKSGEENALYRSRNIGSLAADFHRTLLRGGVFMYPPTSLFPEGKLRLVYEANPIAYLAEQAGGIATNGAQAILSVTPRSLHQRVPLFVGSRLEMERLDCYVKKPLMA